MTMHPAAQAYFNALEFALENDEPTEGIELLGLGKVADTVVKFAKAAFYEMQRVVCGIDNIYNDVRAFWNTVGSKVVIEVLSKLSFPELDISVKEPIVRAALELVQRVGHSLVCRNYVGD